MITYEQLREWRDLCEYLDREWYKFVEEIPPRFSVMSDINKDHREFLWSMYMIQLVRYGRHPHASYHRKSDYRKAYGWRLLSGWEEKIDFLEQIILFGRSADDLLQPWKQEIWAAFFKRRRRWTEESTRRAQEKRLADEQQLKEGDCPLNLGCRTMTNANKAGECSNFQECLSTKRRI